MFVHLCTDTDKLLPELTVDTLPPLDTSTASDSTGSLLDADPLDEFNDSRLSPLRLPDAPLSYKDPLTQHEDPPSPTDTNTIIDELTKFPSDLWQPSDSFVEERKTFEHEHKDLLSPTDTIGLIGGDGTKFGKGRLSFSPVEGRRKLDFDTLSEESSVVGYDNGLFSAPSSLSMSTVTQSPRRHADQDFDSQSLISVTPRGSSLIKAGDIYSSIMSQTRSSRAKTRGQTRSASPDRGPGPGPILTSSASTGTQLTSPSRSPGTHIKSLKRSLSPPFLSSGTNTGARLTSPIRSPSRSLSPSTSPIRSSVHNRLRSPTRAVSPPTSPTRTTVHDRPLNLYRALSPSTSATRTTVHSRPRSPTRAISPPKSLGITLDQTSAMAPLSPNRNTRSHLKAALRSHGTSIESSPLSKESKKSVTFMLGSIDGSKIDDKDKKEEFKRDLFTSPSRMPETERQLSGSVHGAMDQSQRDLWNSSFNRNNSNANEDSLIHTSALMHTPQENRYSNLVLGRDKNEFLFDSESQREDRLRGATELFKDEDRKWESSKSDSTMNHPISSDSRILANSYSFSLHHANDDVGLSKVSQSRNPLHSSSHSPPTSLHSSLSTNMLDPTHTNPRLHEPLSLPDSPNPITHTVSPSATNNTQGSILDRPQSSDSNISDESRPNRRQNGVMSDLSPHHVHHLLTPAPEPSQHLSDRERSSQQQRSRVEVTETEQEVRGRVDSNLRFTDESDAYAAYSSKVNFTPNPKSGE